MFIHFINDMDMSLTFKTLSSPVNMISFLKFLTLKLATFVNAVLYAAFYFECE